jgi:hypothetical protein
MTFPIPGKVVNRMTLPAKSLRPKAEKGRYDTLSVLPFAFEKQNYALALSDENPYLIQSLTSLFSEKGQVR